jgi:hypothetical protein
VVNLLKFKENAVYEDGPLTGLAGRLNIATGEAEGQYSSQRIDPVPSSPAWI